MTGVLVTITLGNMFLKPYKDSRANITATLSYTANLCIAIINISKSGLATFDCKTNCSLKETILWYFALSEKILLIYLPVSAIALWMLIEGFQKCHSKSKHE